MIHDWFMQILDNLHNESLSLVLRAGEEQHLVLLNPENVKVSVCQEEGSALKLHVISLSDADSLIDVSVEQNAQGCRTELYGLALTSGEQSVGMSTHLLHNVGGGFSSQLFKNVLAGASHASFLGELKVLPDAQKTEAYQTNRNILLSPTTKMRTQPQLEIYADDVKCSHGATTGQLDDQALFYMRQRGVSLADARLLLLQAFLGDVLATMPDEAFRTQIEETLAARLLQLR